MKPYTIQGKLNPQNPNEFQTNEYGVLYRNTFSRKIVDTFGAVRDRDSDGSLLIFDEENIKKLKTMYECEVQEKDKAKVVAPDINVEPTKAEDANALEVKVKVV
jgi:hypothetical protein